MRIFSVNYALMVIAWLKEVSPIAAVLNIDIDRWSNG